ERADRCIIKMEVDYSATVDQHLPECEKLAKEGRLQEVIETFLSLEKQTHTASDMVSTSQILVAVVKMFYEAKEWDLLNENITLLSKRRSQLIQAVYCTYVEEITDLPIKLQLIDTLQMVTEGKIYVEIESTIKEQNGDVKDAASILRELQKEQVEFILEQMRLCLAKINTKFFQKENTEKLKAIYNTPCIWAESEKWQQALKSVLLCVILAPLDNEQSDLVHQVSHDKKSEAIPQYKDLLKLFTTMELMCWSTLVEDYGMELRKGSLENPATDVFGSTEEGETRWKDLKNRVVEHNIRIMAKYYTQITMKRMVQLLDLSVDESESRQRKHSLAGILISDFLPLEL
uniref:PCI domain-containing protein n=1 Tax=Colobus angolensis palliatus TaxID=336983 RepID=A0A2K5HPR9_COLAP